MSSLIISRVVWTIGFGNHIRSHPGIIGNLEKLVARKREMAERPVFLPAPHSPQNVSEKRIEFTWYAGFAVTQAQKSIRSLHLAANAQGISPVLEISTKAINDTGVRLSAFNLEIARNGVSTSVECAFQGSKVFRNGGPYVELYTATSRDAKRDPRLRESGSLTAFEFMGTGFPLQPTTAFYDWLYLTALVQNPSLAAQVLNYRGFTDIAFNPEKSWNCQARSVALYVALKLRGVDVEALVRDVDEYLGLMRGEAPNSGNPTSETVTQMSLLPEVAHTKPHALKTRKKK